VVENGYRQPYKLEVVDPVYDAFLDSDQRLLEVAKTRLAKLPFDSLDLLIVQEIGKTISGTGMDLNVIGKWRATGGGERKPDFRRIAALSLTPPSLGNGLGAGLADFVTRHLMDDYDPAVTYVNLLTATEPGGSTREGPLPLALDSEREAIEVALYSSLAGPAPRVCMIRNTARLHEFHVSEPLLKQLDGRREFVVEAPPAPLAFDSLGNLA
jgi:hypothetical protein